MSCWRVNESAVLEHAGVVDEHVDRPLGTFHRRRELGRGGGHRQVSWRHPDFHTMRRGERLGEDLEFVGAARHQHQIEPALRKARGECLADARRRSGDKRGLPGAGGFRGGHGVRRVPQEEESGVISAPRVRGFWA
jgi:hypothetical protein